MAPKGGHALVLAIAGLVLLAAGQAAQAPITLLPESSKGRCMDGTPGAYYHFANASSRGWVLSLQGGGECGTKEQCDARKGSGLFSSKYLAASTEPHFLLSDVKENPLLRTWNRVELAYCSQDLWTGQVETPSNDTWGYYFSGHLILEAILDALDEKGLKHATEIILSGDSAGGIGVWPHLDWLAYRYPNARVSGVPIAGFYFFAHPYTGPGSDAAAKDALTDFREEAWPDHAKRWNSFVDADCAAAIEPWKCILANNSFPYVQSDAFIVESNVDSLVTVAHDWVPLSQAKQMNFSKPVLSYLNEWNKNLSVALAPSMSTTSRNGVFSPACFIHTDFHSTYPLLGGRSYMEVLTDWYVFGAGPETKLQDPCGILCNPTCFGKQDDVLII